MATAIWLVYLGGVANGAKTLLVMAALAGLVCSVFAVLYSTIEETERPTWAFGNLKWIGLALGAALLIPSKTVLYAAAAIQAGDAALQTETGDLAVQALNAWLRDQINGPAPEQQQP